MKKAIKFINWLCRKFKIPEYSLLCEYSPVDYLYSLPDSPKNVYVWKLKRDVNNAPYITQIAKKLSKDNINIEALHIFTNDIEDIKKLNPDKVKMLLEHYYSDNAQDGGRKR